LANREGAAEHGEKVIGTFCYPEPHPRRSHDCGAALWYIAAMKRVFISFRSEDRPQVNGLRLLAANPKFDIEFYDESVRTPFDSNDPAYIRRRIREKINRTSVTVCLVNTFTYTSQWVNWELEESLDKGNEIICMGLPNAPQSLTLPEPARRLKLKWYFWDINFLHQLIEKAP
jgi:hypothetical protein